MNLDKSLDEIISDRKTTSGPGAGGRHRPPRHGGSRVDKSDRSSRRGPYDRRSRGATLLVSNVFYDLTEDELRSLFNRVGPVRSLRIDYDRSGRSQGTARVHFDDIEDAYEAVRRYNGKKAAGQELRIEILGKSNRSLGDRVRPGRGHDGPSSEVPTGPRGGPSDRSGRGRGGRGRGGTRKAKKTAEELDAELDAYMTGTPAAGDADNAEAQDGSKDNSAATQPTTSDPPPTAASVEDEIMID